MGLNWVEDTVSHLYKLKGYLVIDNEGLPMPRTARRRVRGHSDIDVMAIKDNELIHVECQSWWGPAKADEQRQFDRLAERFALAPDMIFNKYSFLDRSKITVKRKIFVTSGKPKRSTGKGPWDRLQNFCCDNKVELVEINTIIKELVAELRKKFPTPEIVGREQGIARFLLHLIHNGFLKEDIIQCSVS